MSLKINKYTVPRIPFGMAQASGPHAYGLINQMYGKSAEAMWEYVKLYTMAGAAALGIVTAAAAAAAAATSSIPTLMCNVESIGYGVKPIILNPTVQQNTLDFVQGLTMPGPPPMTPAGAAGWWTSSSIQTITTNQ